MNHGAECPIQYLSGLWPFGSFGQTSAPECICNATLSPSQAKSGTGVKIGIRCSIVWLSNPFFYLSLASAHPPSLFFLRVLPPMLKTSSIKVLLLLLFSIIILTVHLKRHTNHQLYISFESNSLPTYKDKWGLSLLQKWTKHKLVSQPVISIVNLHLRWTEFSS